MRPERSSPEARERANMRLRRLTRSAVIAATGATALIGVVVAKEHPGASSGASPKGTTPALPPTTSTTTSPPTTTPTTATPTTSTPTTPATSGGSSTPATVPTTLAPTTTTTTPTPHDHHDSSRGHVGRHVAVTATSSSQALAQRSFRAIGTTATVVVVDASRLDAAESLLRDEIEAIDLACSRFRPDSELARLHSLAGSSVAVSPLLFEALQVAVDVAERTRGAVDPTVGNAMSTLGYDRDFDQIRDQPSLPSRSLGPVVGYGHVHLDARTRKVRIPKGVRLDLGASAKAFAADRSAAHLATQLDTGVLVSLGGDVAVAGPPPSGGWAIGIAWNRRRPRVTLIRWWPSMKAVWRVRVLRYERGTWGPRRSITS